MFNEEEKETPILNSERMNVIIPQCCREGWDTCPHVPKKQRKSKTNVGL
jgi:hypothetical protein